MASVDFMPTPSCCDRLTLRVVLLKVSPLVAWLISVPDDVSLEELHDVLQFVFGWSGQAFYNFRIHGPRLADDATCELTSCASSSFGAAKSSYTPNPICHPKEPDNQGITTAFGQRNFHIRELSIEPIWNAFHNCPNDSGTPG